MKKRIISLLLAVVMLFSCLSLNIFATEETTVNGDSAAEASVVSDTFTDHDSADIVAAINAAKIPNSPHSYSDGTTGIAENNNVAIKYENGKIVKMPGSSSQSRVQLANHTSLGGREVLQNFTASNLGIGNSFVLQATWEFTDAFKGGNELIFQISDYIAKNLGNGYGGNPYCYTTDGGMPSLLSVNSSMQLVANVASTNSSRENKVVMQLQRNVEYTFSVFVDVDYVDEATDTYGTFDVYVNGELKMGGLKLFNKYMNDNQYTFDEKIPYANQGQWSNLGGKVLNDGATIYFLSETVPENVDEILAACGITCAGTYTAKATGRTKQGVKDFSLGFVRYQMSSTNYSTAPFYLDNLMCYYTDEFRGTFLEHELTSTHAHDYTKATVEVITTCALCDGKKVENALIDANGDRVCDICVGELPSGGLMTPNEIKDAGINYIVSTEFNNNSGWNNQVNGNDQNANGTIGLRQTEDGNVYVAYGKPTTPTNAGAYVQTNTSAGGRESALQHREALAGAAYTIAFDVMHDGTVNHPYLLDLYSYTAVAGTKDENGIYTTISQTNATNWYPIKMNSDGALYYNDGARGASSDNWVYTGVKIPANEFHNIVFYHNPANNAFSLYYDGVCVAANIQALNDAKIASMTWTATAAAMKARYASYVQDSYFKDGYFTMNGAADWTLGFARFPQYSSHYAKTIDGTNVILSEDGKTLTINGNDYEVDGLKYAVSADGKTAYEPREFHENDYFAIDDLKVYYTDENVECAHDYTLTHSHDLESGVNNVTYACKFCDKVVEAKVPMTDYTAFDGSGKILSVDEVIEQADKNIHSTEFSATNTSGGLSVNGSSTVVSANDGNGNYYIKYAGSGTNGYCQAIVFSSDGRESAAQNYGTYRGKAFTVTHDFMLDENFTTSSPLRLFEIMSHLYSSNDCTTIADITASSPLSINEDRQLVYPIFTANTNSVASYVSVSDSLEAGRWYTISLYFTPVTNSYDIYINGEQVANDVTMLSDVMKNRLNWSSANLTYANIDYPDDAPVNAEGKKVFVVDGPEDFMPTYIRFAQIAPSTDMFYLDNVKTYFNDEFIECAHKYTDSLACDWCGKTASVTHCDICDGEAISANAAVVGKSVSLGELIDMNVYVKYLGDTKGVYANLVAGNKEEAIALDALEAGENGTYKLSIALNSIMMAEDVTLSLDGGEYTTSVKEYAEELIAISENKTETALAKALLNFGAYAQTYFAEKNEDATIAELLANAGLDEADKTLPKYDVEEFEQYAFSTKGAAENVTFTSVSLTLSAKTYINLYFTAPEGATVKVNGKTYTPVLADGEYCVTLTVSTPDKAVQAFEVAVTDGEETVYAYVSAASAVYAALANNASSEKLVNLLTAYCAYAEYAAAYVLGL